MAEKDRSKREMGSDRITYNELYDQLDVGFDIRDKDKNSRRRAGQPVAQDITILSRL